MKNETRKSVYLFLSALLGALMFLVLHRLLMFGYLLLLNVDYTSFSFGMSSLEILAWDYFTLMLVIFMGMWYGIWVGLHWYDLVYEQRVHGGLVKFLHNKLWGSGNGKRFPEKVNNVARHVETEMWQLEDLAQDIASAHEAAVSVPVKRRVTRTKAAAKVK